MEIGCLTSLTGKDADMAVFFTRITLAGISKKNDNTYQGKFFLDVGAFNLFKGFRFKINPAAHHFVVYKNRRVFVKQVGPITKDKLKKYTQEQRLILSSLKIIFAEYQGRLDVRAVALTTREPGDRISINTMTPDIFTKAIIQACL